MRNEDRALILVIILMGMLSLFCVLLGKMFKLI